MQTFTASPLVSTKWGFKDPAATTAEILKVLEYGYEIRVVGALNGALLVERAVWPYIGTWSLNDNGGEINVAKVNDPTPVRSVPVTNFGTPLDGGTIAYRIITTIRGAVIDYDHRFDEIAMSAIDDVRAARLKQAGGV